MNNFIHNLEIKNFKSLKHIKTDCKRVNVFIGKPNVGKSNILEAIGVLGASYSRADKFLSDFIRYEEISNLFYDDDLTKKIDIIANDVHACIRFHNNSINCADIVIGHSKLVEDVSKPKRNISEAVKLVEDELNQISDKLKNLLIKPFYVALRTNGIRITSEPENTESFNENPIKKYHFKNSENISNKFSNFLLPPFGDNLFTIVDNNKELRKEIAEIFSDYGLNFVAYKKHSKFEIEKNIDGYVNKYPYSNMADTFQRLIFYYAAIDSNKNSILILEEPEVHSFPPYTKDLSERIIDSKENQFFITTHSPYLVQNLISNLDVSELNIHITYFEDYETRIKKLSNDDLRKVSEFSTDLFFNLDQFVKNA